MVMKVTKKSTLTGNINSYDCCCTWEELGEWLEFGGDLRAIMPNADEDTMRFLLLGCTPEEWAEHESGN